MLSYTSHILWQGTKSAWGKVFPSFHNTCRAQLCRWVGDVFPPQLPAKLQPQKKVLHRAGVASPHCSVLQEKQKEPVCRLHSFSISQFLTSLIIFWSEVVFLFPRWQSVSHFLKLFARLFSPSLQSFPDIMATGCQCRRLYLLLAFL